MFGSSEDQALTIRIGPPREPPRLRPLALPAPEQYQAPRLLLPRRARYSLSEQPRGTPRDPPQERLPRVDDGVPVALVADRPARLDGGEAPGVLLEPVVGRQRRAAPAGVLIRRRRAEEDGGARRRRVPGQGRGYNAGRCEGQGRRGQREERQREQGGHRFFQQCQTNSPPPKRREKASRFSWGRSTNNARTCQNARFPRIQVCFHIRSSLYVGTACQLSVHLLLLGGKAPQAPVNRTRPENRGQYKSSCYGESTTGSGK